MFGYAYLKAYVESAKPKLEIFKNKIYPTKATEKREENRVLPPITIKIYLHFKWPYKMRGTKLKKPYLDKANGED